jgi:SAM-dependent methyltransferase
MFDIDEEQRAGLPDYRQLPEFANRNTHNTVHALMNELMGDLRGKLVCDLPCGAGSFSVRLATHGAITIPVDIEHHEPFYFLADRLVIADANQRIPCEDGSLDAMVSIEGIEHFENPTNFLRECSRVIKPDGFVFITTPNVDSFRSRKSVLIKGYPRFFEPVAIDEKAAGHLLPIDMVFFRGAAKKAGLEIVRITVNRPGSRLLARALGNLLTRRLPREMRGSIPFFGDVIIYALQRKPA